MSTFTKLTITGIDQDRPPKIRKEAYIDLFFRLSEKAPPDWCEEFNSLGRKINPAAKIDIGSAIIIGTYVNDMHRIPAHLAEIKQVVSDCNLHQIEKIRQRELALAASNAALQGQGDAQDSLNQIVAALDFDSPDSAATG